ncbi:MAG TPA: glycosyltransferase [Chthoniobacterales bacterium]|jgi:GT2 family glycosyltransferase|nr:glycosyltransferase [Chthoniobacterales bacterium]
MNQNFDEPAVELVAIINSFNRRSLLQRAVTSLAESLRKASFGSAVVVFEAGSNDGSVEFLNEWQQRNSGDKLLVIDAPTDRRSFADGVNQACAAAVARFPDCRWFLLYETDNYLNDVDPLEKAVALLKQQPQLAAAGFTLKHYDGEFCGYGMRFPTALSFALGQNVAGPLGLHSPNDSAWQIGDDVRWRHCDIVFTSPLLVRREAWEQTGGLDANAFPFSDTDLDWAWHCAKLGWKMAVIATEHVVHDNLEQLSAWSANRAIDFHRNRLKLLKRYRGKHLALLKPILFARHCLESMILARRSGADPRAKEKLAKRKQLLRTVWNNYS